MDSKGSAILSLVFMGSIKERPARIAGWIPVRGANKPGELPRLGGLVDISRTGARLYLGWRYSAGDLVPLALNVPGTRQVYQMPARIVWVRKDETGSLSSFEARLKLMRDLARTGNAPQKMVFGWMYGVRFVPAIAPGIIQVIQKHLEEKSDRRPGGAALTMQPPEPGDEPKYR